VVAQVRVCVVEDDDEVRESIASFFRSAGIEVVAYRAAEELLSSGRLAEADFIISDLHMPGLSGLDLLREVRRRGMDVPLVIMTAFATSEARAVADELGVSAFLCKPVDPEDLLRRVRAQRY
jgi:DNA-binding response OmpR family regulator